MPLSSKGCRLCAICCVQRGATSGIMPAPIEMAHSLHPLLESGILLTAVSAVLLNFYFNGGKVDEAGVIAAAKTAEAH